MLWNILCVAAYLFITWGLVSHEMKKEPRL